MDINTRKGEPKVIALLLSVEEAQAILDVSAFVGGSPETTPRGRIDEIKNALCKAMCKDPEGFDFWNNSEMSGKLMFLEDSDESE